MCHSLSQASTTFHRHFKMLKIIICTLYIYLNAGKIELGGVGHCFAWQATRPFLGNGCGSCIANCHYAIALLNSQTIHDKGNHQFIWIGLKPTFCMSIFLKVMVRLSHGYQFTCGAWETGSTVTGMVWEFCNWGYTVPLTVVSWYCTVFSSCTT